MSSMCQPTRQTGTGLDVDSCLTRPGLPAARSVVSTPRAVGNGAGGGAEPYRKLRMADTLNNADCYRTGTEHRNEKHRQESVDHLREDIHGKAYEAVHPNALGKPLMSFLP